MCVKDYLLMQIELCEFDISSIAGLTFIADNIRGLIESGLVCSPRVFVHSKILLLNISVDWPVTDNRPVQVVVFKHRVSSEDWNWLVELNERSADRAGKK